MRMFMICTAQIFGEKIKKNEMKETCSIQGERIGEDRVEVGKSE